ncbi:MAG TPA: glycosyltransferase family 4 protein [Tissierellaceae bacterium]|nr:glycosyltransferase family 4 protein [Tissierellaceae bacterium]
MKKVLILANNSIGLYNFRFELVKEMIQEGFQVYFTVPESGDDEKVKLLKEVGAKFIHTPMNRRGINPIEDLKLINLYKEVIDNLKPDIVLTYTIKPNIYGNYIANKFRIPVIMNITGIGSSLSTGKLKVIIKMLYKYAGSKSNTVFFQNQNNKHFFVSQGLVDESKTQLIPGSGVNIEKFKPMEVIENGNTIRFLFIGRLMKEKGIEEYLEVAEELTMKYNNLEFQVLGLPEEDKYKEQIENNNNVIRYLGTSHDVRNEINQVDCVINPSYHEGMSNVLLEGAAMGKPLLASNIPGCKEIIDHEENGLLFKSKSVESLKEAIIDFINLSDNERKIMGQKSRIKVEKEFDRDIVVSEYMKVIKNILEGGVKSESI